MRRFDEALKRQALSRRVGDVLLTFESPVLVGEAVRPPASWWPTALSLVAVVSGLAAVGWLLTVPSPWLGTVLLAVAAGAAWASLRVRGVERARRRFAFNFASHALHVQAPRSALRGVRRFTVPFDAVCGLSVHEQADGRACLTVDVEGVASGGQVFRELLVAHVPASERSSLEGLHRQLWGALDVGRAGEGAAVGAGGAEDEVDAVVDTFEPHDAAGR